MGCDQSGTVKSSERKIHSAPILKHNAEAAVACKIVQGANAPQFISQPLEEDEDEATEVMPTAELVTEVAIACRSSFLTQKLGCEKPESKLKSEVVPSNLKVRKKKKVKSSNVVVEESVAEGQNIREQVVAQDGR